MNINRLRWLSERIINTEKEEFEEFIDTYDKDIVSFVVEACYEKKPSSPTDLFILLKNAVSKRVEKLSLEGVEYSSKDNLYFARALEVFDKPYTTVKYKRLEALFDVINTDPKYFNDMAINSIMHETSFSDEIHTDCCLEVKKDIICYPGFSLDEKEEMLNAMNDIDSMPSIPPLILEGFFEYLNLKDIFKQDYSKFGNLEHELRKTMVNYIIEDYKDDKILINDFALYKSISHFKEAFDPDNLEILEVVLKSKDIFTFLTATNFIRKNKNEDEEGLQILMEKLVSADRISFAYMQYLLKKEEFIEKPMEEKISTFDKILEREEKEKIKSKQSDFKKI